MKKQVKIVLWALVFVFLCFTFMMFADTLALFESNASGEADMDIGKWVIKVSDVSITDGESQSIVVDSFVYEENEHVESGYIAPGTSAYFDLIFDATECDVAVKYDIAFNFESIDYSDNISISVSGAENNSNVIRTAENTYSGVIDLESIENNELVTLQVEITWDNLEAYDESDTALGIEHGNKLRVPITVNAVQYLGETIVPYDPTAEPEEPVDPVEP